VEVGSRVLVAGRAAFMKVVMAGLYRPGL
jgi:hypothetical protein